MPSRLLTPLVLCAATLTTPALAGDGTTWYVDENGTAPGDGSEANPYVSIEYALDQPTTVSGDTVLVAPGTYVGNVDFANKAVWLRSERGPVSTHIVPASSSEPTVFGGFGYQSRVTGFTVRDNTGQPAIQAWFGEGFTVDHCIIRDNFEGLENNWDMAISSCTIVGNTNGVGHFGGGHGADSITTMRSTILWNNDEDFYGWGYVAPYWNASHNLYEDPLFFGPGDFHLLPGSPAINAGLEGATDPDGSRLDIGALPYDPNYPLGESYCTPTANTSGGRAVIAVSGSASLSANDLVFSATRTPVDSSGLFFYGTDQDYYPLGDGFVCLGGSVGRLPLAPTGPTGVPVYAMDNTADLPPHVPPILPGESRGFQYWFRDPFGGPSGWNYSNAVWITFAP